MFRVCEAACKIRAGDRGISRGKGGAGSADPAMMARNGWAIFGNGEGTLFPGRLLSLEECCKSVTAIRRVNGFPTSSVEG